MPPATISSEEYALDEGRQRLGVDPVLAHNHCQLPHELGPKAEASHPASIPVLSENSVRHEAHAQPQRNGTRWKSCWICFSASSTGRKKVRERFSNCTRLRVIQDSRFDGSALGLAGP